jgi:hypothetical protein
VGQRGGQLLGHRRPAVGLLGGDLEHRLQAIGRDCLGQRPPPPARQVAHHGDAVDARTFGIELAQPAAGFVQRQRLPDRHAAMSGSSIRTVMAPPDVELG